MTVTDTPPNRISMTSVSLPLQTRWHLIKLVWSLVWNAEGSGSLVRRIESLHGLHTLEHAEEIGLGSRTYNLVSLDA